MPSPLVSCSMLKPVLTFHISSLLMAKRFKRKLSRFIPSLQFCRTTSAETPLPAIYRLSPVKSRGFDISFPNSLPPTPPSTPECPLPKRHVSSKKVRSIEWSCRSGSCTQNLWTDGSFPHYTSKKEAARKNVVSKQPKPRRKIYAASSAGDVSPVWVNKNKKTSQTKKKEQKTLASTSSRDIGYFSSEEDESNETEALIFISRSFSNELDHSLESTTVRYYEGENGGKNKKVITNIKKIRRTKRYNSKNYKGSIMTVSSPEMESPLKATVLKRVIPCTVDGKLRESVAVVKKSVDPYEDFKTSMLEMILEKQMFETKDLEELLQCFLSLNSRTYHGIIVEAFSEIWEVLFL